MHIDTATKTSRLFSRETFRIVILALLTVLIWCAVEDRWSAEAWRTPVEYYSDPGAMDILSVFATIKAAADGDYIPLKLKFNPHLSAPYGASWNDYPNNEQIQGFLTGMLADSVGLFAAANAVMLLLHVLAALSFYFVCRQFRCSWQWAFAMALVFAFSPFMFAQGQHHMTVASCWHIPLCLLVCRWASIGGGLRWKDWRFRFALAVAFLAGIQNVYYAAMFLQLLGIGCVLQFARGRRDAVLPAITVGAVTFATFLLMNVNTFVFHHEFGPNNAAVTRHYEEIEWTAMKFMDFFMPWQHRLPAFENWSRNYFSQAWVRGEYPPSNYFGIVGIIALAWFFLRVCRRVLARPARPIPLGALQFGWVFLFSIVGGVNGLLGSMGFILFRATARYSIFLLCIVLLFLARRLSTLTKKSPALSGSLAFATVALALWDQTPKWKTADDLQKIAVLVGSDRRFTEAVEKRLPEGAMIFEEPIMDYPEYKTPTVLSYEHFRPYLFSQTLRYSFGGDKGRPSTDWQHRLDGLPLPDLVAALQHYGFSAILINRRGLPNLSWGAQNEEELSKELKSSGLTDLLISPNSDFLCIFLKPDPNPVPPLQASPH